MKQCSPCFAVQLIGTSPWFSQGVVPCVCITTCGSDLESGAVPAYPKKPPAPTPVISAFTGEGPPFAITPHVSSEIPDKPANAQEVSRLEFLHPGLEGSAGR